jgi:hypothetical protein
MVAADTQVRTPNMYSVHGHGVAVTYTPTGHGPILAGQDGPTVFVYQDSQRSLAFAEPDVSTVTVPGIGTLVSVTIARTVDVGSTTFSLVVPDVVLTNGGPNNIDTVGLTTVNHSPLIGPAGHPQQETYTTRRLRGTAANVELPA